MNYLVICCGTLYSSHRIFWFSMASFRLFSTLLNRDLPLLTSMKIISSISLLSISLNIKKSIGLPINLLL